MEELARTIRTRVAPAPKDSMDLFVSSEIARMLPSAACSVKMEEAAVVERRIISCLSSSEMSSRNSTRPTSFGNTVSALKDTLESSANINSKSARVDNMFACMVPRVSLRMKLVATIDMPATVTKPTTPTKSMRVDTASTPALRFVRTMASLGSEKQTLPSASTMGSARAKSTTIKTILDVHVPMDLKAHTANSCRHYRHLVSLKSKQKSQTQRAALLLGWLLLCSS
mmetsp:Transcript_11104/g.31968  ORF Transcript_11104/g.31968 Transcript_11104/m.31968 type:complete len:227 (+) Transcript_11104:30-710(+)